MHSIICIRFSLLDILADVLSEDTIIKWYKGAHSSKGKNVFLEQMKKMVEWLQSAEEGRPAKSPQPPLPPGRISAFELLKIVLFNCPPPGQNSVQMSHPIVGFGLCFNIPTHVS